MRKFKVAGIQIDSKVADLRGNLKKALGLIEEAAANGAKLVCLPELFPVGYSPKSIKEKAGEISSEVSIKLSQSAEKNSIYIVAGVPIPDGGRLFNAALFFGPDGKLLGKYYKSHLISTEDMNEPELFTRGELDDTVHDTGQDLGRAKIGIMICYDLRFPELARKLAIKGAQLIIVPSAWPQVRVNAFKTLCAARAVENQLFLLAVNRVGTDEGITFGGNTALYDPLGNAVSPGRLGEGAGDDAALIYEVDLDFLAETRKKMDCLGGRFESYGI